jgi:hypothetical protein
LAWASLGAVGRVLGLGVTRRGRAADHRRMAADCSVKPALTGDKVVLRRATSTESG